MEEPHVPRDDHHTMPLGDREVCIDDPASSSTERIIMKTQHAQPAKGAETQLEHQLEELRQLYDLEDQMMGEIRQAIQEAEHAHDIHEGRGMHSEFKSGFGPRGAPAWIWEAWLLAMTLGLAFEAMMSGGREVMARIYACCLEGRILRKLKQAMRGRIRFREADEEPELPR